MISAYIQEQKKVCENNKKITFIIFTTNDTKNFSVEVGLFPKLEDINQNGLKLIFTHKTNDPKIQYKFMTIVFLKSFINHPEMVISQALRKIVGKKVRIYQGIFEHDYFDFEEQCFPITMFKIKE